MSATSILVVDDEPELRTLLMTGLAGHGYAVTTATDGAEALVKLMETRPDLIILDLEMPVLSGIDVCRQLRTWSLIPIIVLSVRDDEQDKITALDLGADDYVTKPFTMGELLARVRVALRHGAARAAPETPVLLFDELRIDLAMRQVRLAEQHIYLTRKEYDLLIALARRAGSVRTYSQLLHEVWGNEADHDVRTLRVLMGQLRRKLQDTGPYQRFIFTESGIGYRFRA